MDAVVRGAVVTRSYAKWRTASLVGIHVLFIAHFIHWKLKGRTLAPLEFNEVLYTIHQGIVTAGFILMALVMVATLIFGRFFCSWGCHILALQDAAGWLLDKLRVKRQPIRSRTLVWLPLVVMFYLFIWPQILQIWHGTGSPAVHVVEAGTSRWSSFTTDDLWRNLPPPGVALLTFFVCGFLIVYLLGSRGFCFQACPYGALFSIADQLAPGRIVLAKDCTQCGLCTKACSSDILVHRELAVHGMVTNPRCLKDLDCIAACPENAVRFGFRKPPLFRGGHPMGAYRGRYSLSLGEDLFMLGFFIPGMLVYRGLYDAIPFLLAVALSLCTAYLLVVGYRLVRQGTLRMRGLLLKMDHGLRPAGIGFAGALLIVLLFLGHSAYVQYHTQVGRQLFRSVAEGDVDDGSLEGAIRHYEQALSTGLLTTVDREQELASLYLLRGDRSSAQRLLNAIVAEDPDHMEANYRLGDIALDQGDEPTAKAHWHGVLASGSTRASVLDRVPLLRAALDLGAVYESHGETDRALAVYQQGLNHLPDALDLLLRSGTVESRSGMDAPAIAHFERALKAGGDPAMLHNNLGTLHLRNGRLLQAVQHFERLTDLMPRDARVRYTLGVVYARIGNEALAREQLDIALHLDPTDQRSAKALAVLSGGTTLNHQ
ncbi:MAG: tetratricopeptide repeat protein [Flavobacteriales bacterium]|nr:tetratricopeptide repeat protein [Flavobacteriales bacterium]